MDKPVPTVETITQVYYYWDDIIQFIKDAYYKGTDIEYATHLIAKDKDGKLIFDHQFEFWEFILRHYSSDIVSEQTTYISFDILSDDCQKSIDAEWMMDHTPPEECEAYWYKQIIDHIIEEFGGSFDVYFSF